MIDKAIAIVASCLGLSVLLFVIMQAVAHSFGHHVGWAPDYVVNATKDMMLAIVAGLIGFISGNYRNSRGGSEEDQ
jgi:hypothetical protein